jgi:hypothetical protein
LSVISRFASFRAIESLDNTYIQILIAHLNREAAKGVFRRRRCDGSGLHVEAGAVPGTLHFIAVYPAAIAKWQALVRAHTFGAKRLAVDEVEREKEAAYLNGDDLARFDVYEWPRGQEFHHPASALAL